MVCSGKTEMRRLVLIRHANPALRSDIPPAEWCLTEAGVRRARALAGRVLPGSARAVYTSIERKAVETAQLLGTAWQLPVTPVVGLHEHERPGESLVGALEFQRRVRELFERPRDLVYGTETGEQARRRFKRAVANLLATDSDDVIVVSHGTVMTLFVSAAAGVEPFAFWQSLEMPCAVTLTPPALSVAGMTSVEEASATWL
jgi:broad specificity phosphatase PhoE